MTVTRVPYDTVIARARSTRSNDSSAARQCLRDIDLPIRGNGITELAPVLHLPPIHEDHHVWTNRTLLIKNVGTRTWVYLKDGIQRLPDRRTVYGGRRAGNVTLNVRSECDGRHLLQCLSGRLQLLLVIVLRHLRRYLRRRLGISVSFLPVGAPAMRDRV
jgi:hypothetical protein